MAPIVSSESVSEGVSAAGAKWFLRRSQMTPAITMITKKPITTRTVAPEYGCSFPSAFQASSWALLAPLRTCADT